ncbi:MAG: hypothetical protein K8S87_01395 [Planctomycetes bacterium]|nr:hypothetical protein [Planctomycetota bacterium]
MHKYRDSQHYEILFRAMFISVLIVVLILDLCISTIHAQDTPTPKTDNDTPEKDDTVAEAEKAEAEKIKAEKEEAAKKKAEKAKQEKIKDIKEMKEKVLKAKGASSRTIVLNSILMKAINDEDYRSLVKSEIIVDTLDKSILREVLDAISAIGKSTNELLLEDYIASLLVLRINEDYNEKIDEIITIYPKDRLFKSINGILTGVKEINFNNLYTIKYATALATSIQFFSVQYQIKFIEPLINLLNIKHEIKDSENAKNNGIDKELHGFIQKYASDALSTITNYMPEPNDYTNWLSWWKIFEKKPEIEKMSIILENLQKKFSAKSKQLADLREKNQINMLKLNSKSFEINVEALDYNSSNVVLTALENIIAIVDEQKFEIKNRNQLTDRLNKTWFADVSLEVKKRITDLYLKLGGCEPKLRSLFTVEVGIEIRRYIVERIAFEGEDGATLDKLLQIIKERKKYPSEIQKAALKGLGKWNNYLDERNIEAVILTLQEIIDSNDEQCMEPITMVNTINELAGKFDISKLIIHLFDRKPFKPQQLVVLLWSALRSGNSIEFKSWLIEYEKQNKYLVNILLDPESFIDLITTVFELFEILEEPFISPKIYTELYDALSYLYFNVPEGANGLFLPKLEKALINLALPYNNEKKYLELSDAKRKIIEESALIVPELLMKRKLADFILKKLLPHYPSELVQLKQTEIALLRIRLGLRSSEWDQLDIFNAYKTQIQQKKIPDEKIKEDIEWTINYDSEADIRVAPRLIFAVQDVNEKYLDFTWKTVLEYVDAQRKELKTPSGEIYLFKIGKMINSMESLKKLTMNPTNKHLVSLMELLKNAKISFEKWFSETLTVWLKFEELNDEAMKFALTSENFRVVLSNLVERLSKLQINDEKTVEIWKFVDAISTDKNLSLPRFAEAIPKDDFIKRFNELKTKVDALTMK